MADLQRVQTGARIETRVSGRQFRFAPNSQPAHSRERRRICVLSAHSSRMLECWEQEQPCSGPRCTHIHLSRESVARLVRDGVMRWIGRERNVAGYTYGREWKGVPSGPGGKLAMRTMQLV